MAVIVSGEFYKALATLVLFVHILFIVWVVLGLAVVAGGVMIARALGPKP